VEVDSGFIAAVVGRTAQVRPSGELGTIAFDGQQLHFTGVPLKTILSTLRHWYGVEIKLAARGTATRPVTVTIPGTEEAGVAKLCAVIGAHAEREDQAIVLYDAAKR
jgi:hypothetical protein